jgi:two-component system sensor histidine kinase VicK
MVSRLRVYYSVFAAISLAVAALYLDLIRVSIDWDAFTPISVVLAVFGIALFVVLVFQLIQVLRIHSDTKKIEAIGSEVDFINRALNSHAIVSVTDPQANILEVSDKFLDVFGYSRKELIGQNSSFFHSAASGASMFSEIYEHTLRGESWQGEHAGTTKSGETRLFQTTVIPYYDKHGNHLRNFSVRTDVTDSHNAEELRKNKRILDKLHDEVYIFRTSDLKILYVNERAMERCDWNVDEVHTKTIIDTDKSFVEQLFRAHVKPLSDGSKESVVTSVKQAKGFVEINTSLSVQPDGTEVFISVLRDINDRVALKKAKMTSVSVVSHELRTPITSIKGSIQLLQAQLAGTGDTYSSMLDIALRNCDRLMFIVNDILDLEKVESGKMEFNKAPIKVDSFLSEAIAVNQGYARKFDVEFRLNSQYENAYINGDKERLVQVMSNLMSNAVKFSAPGQVVDIGLVDQGDEWRITVTDSGPGISEADQKKLFESFVQVAPSDGKKREGTGLGLAITKKIIQNHGGSIGLSSELGKGTTVHFDISKLKANEFDSTEQIANAAE